MDWRESMKSDVGRRGEPVLTIRLNASPSNATASPASTSPSPEDNKFLNTIGQRFHTKKKKMKQQQLNRRPMLIVSSLILAAMAFSVIQNITFLGFIFDEAKLVNPRSDRLLPMNRTESVVGMGNLAAANNSSPVRTVQDVLKEAGIFGMLNQRQLEMLPPLDRSFRDLYYSKKNNDHDDDDVNQPVIYGLETCETYRKMVAYPDRFVSVAGMFNSGTNNLEIALRQNLQGSNSAELYQGTVHYQVPWGKHRLEARRLHHAADGAEHVNQTSCLPIVIIRDPYHWMQSMCVEQYSAIWKHDDKNRCPNLVLSEHDKHRWEKPQVDESKIHNPKNRDPATRTFQVTVLYEKGNVHYFDSLIDLWNEWYRPYWENKQGYPRLMVRFEDMLFHAPTILQKISQCTGIPPQKSNLFYYHVHSAKLHGSGSDFLHALVKTANPSRRERNLQVQDKIYAATHLDAEMMQAFRYKFVTD